MRKILFLMLALVLPMVASAYDAIIDGIYYYLNTSTKEAEVAVGESGYKGSVTIPETVKYNKITYSVTSIRKGAFSDASDLTSVTIPNSVTSIGDDTFTFCHSLTSVTIPNSVTSIGSGAFYGCDGLTELTIPNGVKTIGYLAFSNCDGLTSATIPNSVTSIGEKVLSSCDSLISIEVESGNTTYDSRDHCNAIIETASNTIITGCKNTVIPNSVTKIGDYAFNASYLTSFTIPDNVTSIGSQAFRDCIRLTSLTIGNGVTSMGTDAFYACSALTSVHITDIAAWCKISYGNYSSNPLYCAKHLFMDGQEITDLVIPNGVTSIGYGAFYNCSDLTSVAMPNSVKSIGQRAFRGCSSLTSVIIPSSMTFFATKAFEDCSGLTDVYCYAEKVPTTNLDVFENVPVSSATLHVPAASIEMYKARSPWSEFGKIVALTDEELKLAMDAVHSEGSMEQAPIYDLGGRRLSTFRKGLNILNGKKVVVK